MYILVDGAPMLTVVSNKKATWQGDSSHVPSLKKNAGKGRGGRLPQCSILKVRFPSA